MFVVLTFLPVFFFFFLSLKKVFAWLTGSADFLVTLIGDCLRGQLYHVSDVGMTGPVFHVLRYGRPGDIPVRDDSNGLEDVVPNGVIRSKLKLRKWGMEMENGGSTKKNAQSVRLRQMLPSSKIISRLAYSKVSI